MNGQAKINVMGYCSSYSTAAENIKSAVGYQLPLGRSFALDFNMGLGYNSFEYDSFSLINDVRVYKEKGQTKNFFGPTQVSISLVWKLVK